MRYEFEFKLFSLWVSNLTRYFYKHSSIHLFVLCKSPSKHNTVSNQCSTTTGIKMASFSPGHKWCLGKQSCSKFVYFSFYIDVLSLMTPFVPFKVSARDSNVQILSGRLVPNKYWRFKVPSQVSLTRRDLECWFLRQIRDETFI